jgi:hypothetical protein
MAEANLPTKDQSYHFRFSTGIGLNILTFEINIFHTFGFWSRLHILIVSLLDIDGT